MKYFVIVGSYDGGCSCTCLSQSELNDKLNKKHWGEGRIILSAIPGDICNFEEIVIIKGEVVVPKEKRTVVEYEV